MAEGFDQLLVARIAQLRGEGWIICPPDCIPLPRTRREAEAMYLLARSYLKGLETQLKDLEELDQLEPVDDEDLINQRRRQKVRAESLHATSER